MDDHPRVVGQSYTQEDGTVWRCVNNCTCVDKFATRVNKILMKMKEVNKKGQLD